MLFVVSRVGPAATQNGAPWGAPFPFPKDALRPQSDLTMPSVIFLASPKSIMVLSRKNSSFWMPA